MSTPKKQYLKRLHSKGALATWSSNVSGQTVYPDFSFHAAFEAINQDPVSRGALIHYVDKAMEGDYAIVTRDTNEYDQSTELILDEKYRFRHEVLRKAFLFRKLTNNVFIEIVRDSDGKTKALNVLDSSQVEPITAPNGDPIAYKGRMPYPAGHPQAGEYPRWDEKDLTWIKFGDRGVGFAPLDIRAVWETLLWKDYIRRYSAWLWRTGQYRLLYNFESASDRDIDSFLAYARKNDENYQAPFITKGKMTTMLLRDMKETTSLREMLAWLDSQILILFRVPPIDAGIPDASGRSNADAQSNNFLTHIGSDKKAVEDGINFDLFPKINKGNSLLKFAPHDRFSEAQVIENLNLLKNMGATDEFMKEYLFDRGMVFKTKQLFKDPAEEARKMAEANPQPLAGSPGMKKDINTMPSRSKADTGTMDKVGTGKQSSSRADQVGGE